MKDILVYRPTDYTVTDILLCCEMTDMLVYSAEEHTEWFRNDQNALPSSLLLPLKLFLTLFCINCIVMAKERKYSLSCPLFSGLECQQSVQFIYKGFHHFRYPGNF